MTLLVGDIGGTRSRFGLTASGSVRPEAVAIGDHAGRSDFESEVADYLDRAGERPERAAFAIAAPVRGRAVRLTNGGLLVDAERLERRFGFRRVVLLNDFVAQAAALPHLLPEEATAIGPAKPRDDATKAAVGPGTGLGVAALLRDGGRWTPIPSEAGHMDLAGSNEREDAAIAAIRRRFGRAEAESALSGPGLVRLHAALHGDEGAPASAAEITELAAAGEPAALETAAIFLSMLARFAGDVALAFRAEGGVYLCGGVTPRLLPLVDPAAFRRSFEDKAPHVGLMRETATVVVSSEVAGLVGCAAALAAPD